MATLGTALKRDFPEFYKYFAERSFTYSGIKQPNRNWLLSRGIGVDGLKTGHTEEDGYHLVSSMLRGRERLVAAVLGTNSMAERANQSQAALNTAAAGGKVQNIIRQNQVLAPEVPVHHGVKRTTTLTANRNLNLFINPKLKSNMSAEITYKQPLIAPIQAGTEVGTLTLKTPYQQFQIALATSEDIAKDSWFNRYLRHAGKKLGL